jgi:hypothetical protein
MTKKKSDQSKNSNNSIENKILTQEKVPSVKTFIKNIWVIIAVILFFFLFINKVLTAFGSIVWTGWLMLGVCFILIIGLGMLISPWIERTTGIDEGKADTLTAILLVGVLVIVSYVFWDYIAPFFGSGVK